MERGEGLWQGLKERGERLGKENPTLKEESEAQVRGFIYGRQSKARKAEIKKRYTVLY